MTEILMLAIGIVIGMYGPRAIAWAFTRDERKRRKVRRANLDDVLSDLASRPQPNVVPIQRAQANPEALKGPAEAGSGQETPAPR